MQNVSMVSKVLEVVGKTMGVVCVLGSEDDGAITLFC